MPVSKRVRFEVFKRDLFTCQYCGKRPPDVVLEVDHVHPRCDGGSDEMDNLTTSCWPCNRGKAGKTLGDVAPATDELARLEAIQEMAERSQLLMREQVVARQQEAAAEVSIAQVLTWWTERTGNDRYFDEHSIRLFIRRGLGLMDIREALDIAAMKSDRDRMSHSVEWRYFCGVCWGMIRDRRDGGD